MVDVDFGLDLYKEIIFGWSKNVWFKVFIVKVSNWLKYKKLCMSETIELFDTVWTKHKN